MDARPSTISFSRRLPLHHLTGRDRRSFPANDGHREAGGPATCLSPIEGTGKSPTLRYCSRRLPRVVVENVDDQSISSGTGSRPIDRPNHDSSRAKNPAPRVIETLDARRKWLRTSTRNALIRDALAMTDLSRESPGGSMQRRRPETAQGFEMQW